jgi:Glycosyl transferase family 2
MSKPLVSVVMVTCNVERFLAEAIESILGQTLKDFEFIIVDFGSTDQSRAIVSSYAAKDNRIALHDIPHCGLAEARNAGGFLATGKYIAIMDADDISEPDRLMSQVRFMEEHPEVGFVGGSIEWIDAAGRSIRIESFPGGNREIQAALPTSCVFCQPTVLMRSDAFNFVGGYRRAFFLAEDYDLWLRMAEHYECANLPKVMLRYRSHPHQVQLRRVREQSLCSLAARASAVSRRNGNSDPLDSVEKITPTAVAALGVSEATQQIFGACDVIRSLHLAGDHGGALKLAIESLRSPDWKHAERWLVAETRLTVARLHWKQGEFAQSLLAAGHAFITRPVILGRPLRPFLRLLRDGKATKGGVEVSAGR